MTWGFFPVSQPMSAIAIISGIQERGVVCEGRRFWLLRPGSPPLAVDGRHWSTMAALSSGLVEVDAGRPPFSPAQKRLDLEVGIERTLIFLTDLFDSSLGEMRSRAVPLAEARLGEPEIARAVEERLLSVPLPDTADFLGALTFTEGSSRVDALLRRVTENQDRIQVVDPLQQEWNRGSAYLSRPLFRKSR